ncbi:MAG TPA: enoyl-CoA hydratase-related protein [Acidimicrobiales bacterium]|jgi:enoyl-CoA hydratase/carnithine racemase|nr:enoyl-CoA hydratase-related protein [Acidimicrobiales bacterium]
MIRAYVDGSIGTLVIDNPARRNAMDLAMYAAVPAAVQSLVAHPALRVVVLRGAGSEAFGAGSDISEFAEQRTGDAALHYNETEAAAARAIETIPVPVIAAIHGPCMGGGVGLALCADLRYAADDARFAVTPAKLGVGYPPDSMARLVTVIGVPRAKDLVLTARTIDAEQASAMGLVHAVVPKADLDAYVESVAATIAALAPLTLRAAKLAIDDPHSEATAAAVNRCYASEDYAEGIRAYRERRAPTFNGR